jgi:hypothetical protein
LNSFITTSKLISPTVIVIFEGLVREKVKSIMAYPGAPPVTAMERIVALPPKLAKPKRKKND